MQKNVRVRFAPSPTGFLHIGGLRTALYNYVFAKKHRGTFILRIEDTDQARFVPGSEAYIIRALSWLGISPDEGPIQGGAMGPYRQSERKDLYKKYALQLVAQGKAYYAFDTPAALEAMRTHLKAAGIASPQYNAISRMKMQNSLTLSADEVAARLASGKPYVVRILIDPSTTIKVKDWVRGWVQVQGASLDDKVLLKADGMATYHLASVVDDHFMGITHVIRGEEWLPSAPLHMLLYQYLGWQPPEFVHLPLLLRTDGGGKLSKRAADQEAFPLAPFNWQDPSTKKTVQGFCEAGYLPEAWCNFIAVLGWHPSGNRELFDKKALIEHFSLSRITKAGARFDIAKAKWFNQQYLKLLPDQLLAKNYLLPMLQKEGIACTKNYAIAICRLVKGAVTFPKDIWENTRYFFYPPTTYAGELAGKDILESAKSFLNNCAMALEKLPSFGATAIGGTIKAQIQIHKLKIGKAMSLIRLATTGVNKGPALAEVLSVLGQKETVQRIKKVCAL